MMKEAKPMDRLWRWMERFKRPDPWRPAKRWFRVELKQYLRIDEAGRPGRDMEGMPIHPYNVPGFVWTYYTEDRRRFVMDFEHITDRAPTEAKQLGPIGVTTIMGKRSGRIYGFELDVEAPGLDTPSGRYRAVRRAIRVARDESATLDHWESAWMSPRIIEHVLEERQPAVFTAPPDPFPGREPAKALAARPSETDVTASLAGSA